MTTLTVVNTTTDTRINDSENDSFDALYRELAKGIQSMENCEIYSIEEAWEEIDKI